MSTSNPTETNYNIANTWVSLWYMIFITIIIVATWGTPDVIDAFIYYLSDGYYR